MTLIEMITVGAFGTLCLFFLIAAVLGQKRNKDGSGSAADSGGSLSFTDGHRGDSDGDNGGDGGGDGGGGDGGGGD